MIELIFMDKKKRVLRKEMYNSESKVKTLFDMLEGNAGVRNLVPAECNFIQVGDKLYWLDKRKSIWSVREMS